jgi:hypothetical protein
LAAFSSLEDKIFVTNMIATPHHMSNQWLPMPNNMSATPAVKPAQPKINCLAFLVCLYITGDVVNVQSSGTAAERDDEKQSDK